MNKTRLIPILTIVLFASLVSRAYASDGEVNLSDFPQKLADALSIPLFAGQLLATGIILALFLLPTLLLTKNVMAHLMMGFISLAVCLALGWIPYWLFILIAVGEALFFAGAVRDMISGKGGGG